MTDKPFDMDEAIKACEEKKKENEVIAFGVGAGRMVPLPFDKKAIKKGIKKALEKIGKMDGFMGIHPMDLYHNIIIFDTLNHCKACRNILISEGCDMGQVVPIIVPKEYAKGE